jgi:hypothetical protein
MPRPPRVSFYHACFAALLRHDRGAGRPHRRLYTPGFSGVLGVRPVSLELWLELLALALVILLAMEAHKWSLRRSAALRAPSTVS